MAFLAKKNSRKYEFRQQTLFYHRNKYTYDDHSGWWTLGTARVSPTSWNATAAGPWSRADTCRSSGSGRQPLRWCCACFTTSTGGSRTCRLAPSWCRPPCHWAVACTPARRWKASTRRRAARSLKSSPPWTAGQGAFTSASTDPTSGPTPSGWPGCRTRTADSPDLFGCSTTSTARPYSSPLSVCSWARYTPWTTSCPSSSSAIRWKPRTSDTRTRLTLSRGRWRGSGSGGYAIGPTISPNR